MKIMSEHGVVTGANIDPIIPGLTDDTASLQMLIGNIALAGASFVCAAVLLLRKDIWHRMRNLFIDLGRSDLLTYYDKLYFTKETRVRGYLAAKEEYVTPLLNMVEETVEKHGMTFGFPSGIMKTRNNRMVVDLKPRKLWNQLSLGNCYLEQVDLTPSRSIETSH
jgi:DNA repair photolyase